MILSILNFFALFREIAAARITAESEMRVWRNRAEQAEARVRELQDELIATHKTLNDKLGQRFLNTRFWSEPEPREAGEHATLAFGRLQGRVAREQMTEKFKGDIEKYFANANDAN